MTQSNPTLVALSIFMLSFSTTGVRADSDGDLDCPDLRGTFRMDESSCDANFNGGEMSDGVIHFPATNLKDTVTAEYYIRTTFQVKQSGCDSLAILARESSGYEYPELVIHTDGKLRRGEGRRSDDWVKTFKWAQRTKALSKQIVSEITYQTPKVDCLSIFCIAEWTHKQGWSLALSDAHDLVVNEKESHFVGLGLVVPWVTTYRNDCILKRVE